MKAVALLAAKMPPSLYYTFLLLFIFCGLLGQVSGATLYVSPTGNDISANGSISSPFLTLNRAVSAFQNGDSILILSGLYQFSETQNITDGVNVTASGSVTITISQPLIAIRVNATTIAPILSNIQFISGGNTNSLPIISIDTRSLLIVLNCTFKSSGNSGSAIEVNSGTLTVRDSTFRDFRATRGAAIYSISETTGAGPVDIIRSQFINNTATQGGAISATGPSSTPVNIEDCSFVENEAISGGALYTADKETTIRGSTFQSNRLVGSGTQYGAAIYHSGVVGNLYVESCLFLRNTASTADLSLALPASGAAIAIPNNTPVTCTIVRSNFEYNSVYCPTTTNACVGGALFTGADTTLIVSDSTFVGNRAGTGGAIYASSYSIRLSLFVENSALIDAGAITHLGGAMEINDCSFIRNSVIGAEMTDYRSRPLAAAVSITAAVDPSILENIRMEDNYGPSDPRLSQSSGPLPVISAAVALRSPGADLIIRGENNVFVATRPGATEIIASVVGTTVSCTGNATITMHGTLLSYSLARCNVLIPRGKILTIAEAAAISITNSSIYVEGEIVFRGSSVTLPVTLTNTTIAIANGAFLTARDSVSFTNGAVDLDSRASIRLVFRNHTFLPLSLTSTTLTAPSGSSPSLIVYPADIVVAGVVDPSLRGMSLGQPPTFNFSTPGPYSGPTYVSTLFRSQLQIQQSSGGIFRISTDGSTFIASLTNPLAGPLPLCQTLFNISLIRCSWLTAASIAFWPSPDYIQRTNLLKLLTPTSQRVFAAANGSISVSLNSTFADIVWIPYRPIPSTLLRQVAPISPPSVLSSVDVSGLTFCGSSGYNLSSSNPNTQLDGLSIPKNESVALSCSPASFPVSRTTLTPWDGQFLYPSVFQLTIPHETSTSINVLQFTNLQQFSTVTTPISISWSGASATNMRFSSNSPYLTILPQVQPNTTLAVNATITAGSLQRNVRLQMTVARLGGILASRPTASIETKLALCVSRDSADPGYAWISLTPQNTHIQLGCSEQVTTLGSDMFFYWFFRQYRSGIQVSTSTLQSLVANNNLTSACLFRSTVQYEFESLDRLFSLRAPTTPNPPPIEYFAIPFPLGHYSSSSRSLFLQGFSTQNPPSPYLGAGLTAIWSIPELNITVNTGASSGLELPPIAGLDGLYGVFNAELRVIDPTSSLVSSDVIPIVLFPSPAYGTLSARQSTNSEPIVLQASGWAAALNPLRYEFYIELNGYKVALAPPQFHPVLRFFHSSATNAQFKFGVRVIDSLEGFGDSGIKTLNSQAQQALTYDYDAAIRSLDVAGARASVLTSSATSLPANIAVDRISYLTRVVGPIDERTCASFTIPALVALGFLDADTSSNATYLQQVLSLVDDCLTISTSSTWTGAFLSRFSAFGEESSSLVLRVLGSVSRRLASLPTEVSLQSQLQTLISKLAAKQSKFGQRAITFGNSDLSITAQSTSSRLGDAPPHAIPNSPYTISFQAKFGAFSPQPSSAVRLHLVHWNPQAFNASGVALVGSPISKIVQIVVPAPSEFELNVTMNYINSSRPASCIGTIFPPCVLSIDESRTLATCICSKQGYVAFSAEIPAPIATTTMPSTSTPNPDTTSGLPVGAIVGGILGAIALIAAVLLLVIFLRRRKRGGNAGDYSNIQAWDAYLSQQAAEGNIDMRSYNIAPKDVILEKEIGKGSFGVVYEGKFKGKRVAVKRLVSAPQDQIGEFYRESTLMLSLEPHENLLRMYGMIQESRNYSMVMEFAENGSLAEALKKKTVDPDDHSALIKLALGIAEGMKALAAQRIVHRDLAARNILLDSKWTPKVCDFGFARAVGEYQQVGSTMNDIGPIRWMSPENIRTQEYSEKSDVWMFGCVLFEMCTGGGEPYGNASVLIIAGARVNDPEAPPTLTQGPQLLIDVANRCWRPNAKDRPSFSKIVELLRAGTV